MVFTNDHSLPTTRMNNKSGYTMTSEGYVLVRKPEHTFSVNGYVLEHRLIMEEYLGRILSSDEIVHHKNEIKTDNRIENLELTNRAEHRGMHNSIDKRGTLKYDIGKIKTLYEKGYSSRDIERMLGVGKSTVTKYVNLLGISRPKNSLRENGKFKKRMVV